MAKKIAGYIKLQIPAGKATPAPPVGPALGQHGVNIMAVSYTHLDVYKRQYPGRYPYGSGRGGSGADGGRFSGRTVYGWFADDHQKARI